MAPTPSSRLIPTLWVPWKSAWFPSTNILAIRSMPMAIWWQNSAPELDMPTLHSRSFVLRYIPTKVFPFPNEWPSSRPVFSPSSLGIPAHGHLWSPMNTPILWEPLYACYAASLHETLTPRRRSIGISTDFVPCLDFFHLMNKCVLTAWVTTDASSRLARMSFGLFLPMKAVGFPSSGRTCSGFGQTPKARPFVLILQLRTDTVTGKRSCAPATILGRVS